MNTNAFRTSNHRRSVVFETLDGHRQANLNDIAALLRSGSINNIIIMAGAGISTRAGIPDFRSPETGIYANLEKFRLPYPEAIFDIDYFKRNPIPFYTLAQEINPKKFKPTKTHQFFKLLEDKKLLKRCFTQNIDTLERSTGLSDHLITEAHGSFATCHCLECRGLVTDDEFMRRLNQSPQRPVKCSEKSCLGKSTALIKPDIVFFGEQLPEKFYDSLDDFSEADLLIVLGTSLQVQPFASLITRVPENCPRLLINLEPVGKINLIDNPGGFDFKGIQRGGQKFIRDVLYLGTTDDGIEELCDLLGWKKELLDLYHRDPNIKTDETSQGNQEEADKIFQTENNGDGEKLLDSQKNCSKEKIDNPGDAVVAENIATCSKVKILDTGKVHEDEPKNPVDQLTCSIDDLSLSGKL